MEAPRGLLVTVSLVTFSIALKWPSGLAAHMVTVTAKATMVLLSL